MNFPQTKNGSSVNDTDAHFEPECGEKKIWTNKIKLNIFFFDLQKK